MGWLSLAARGLFWLLGLIYRKPAVSVEERLGQEETKNENAQAAIDELRKAEAAREDARRRDDADPSRLLDGSDPAAAPYRPGPN
jgi:hypothetical protein